MSGNDIVKYMTQELVRKLDMPQEERKKARELRKSESVTSYSKWFGVIPFGLRMMFQRKKRRG
ncbi:YqzE family protein [Bacillaceae bacterium S4-13-58]